MAEKIWKKILYFWSTYCDLSRYHQYIFENAVKAIIFENLNAFFLQRYGRQVRFEIKEVPALQSNDS